MMTRRTRKMLLQRKPRLYRAHSETKLYYSKQKLILNHVLPNINFNQHFTKDNIKKFYYAK